MRSRLLFKRSFILAAVSLGATILVASQVFADFSLTDWRYVKPIRLPSNLSEEGLIELHPDPELFSGSSPGLVDIRVIAASGSEVPYKFEISKGEHQQTSLSVSLRDKGYVSGKYTTFTADLGREGVLHNRVEFRTPSSNFCRTATVETSNDGVTWAMTRKQQVYDFTVREVGLVSRDTDIRYPDTTARYLRVRIADEEEGPVDVSGATVFFMIETPAREVSWPTSALSSSRDTDRRATLVELDLGIDGLPSHRLALEISEVNFHREVSVEASSDRETWHTLGSRTAIYAFDTQKFVGDSLVLTYPESTSRYIRLAIFNQDNPPLTVNEVEVWGHERRLLFSADPAQSYSLYYGNVNARRPSYDIERVLPYLATEDLPQAALGLQAENPMFVEATTPPPPVSERLPWLFPAVVGVAAVILGLILFGVLRQARKMLPPPAK